MPIGKRLAIYIFAPALLLSLAVSTLILLTTEQKSYSANPQKIAVPQLEAEQVEVTAGVPVEEKISEPKQVTLQFFGDIMLDRDVAKVMGNKGLGYIFAKDTPTSSVFVDADLTIANLEGPFAPTRIQTSKTIAFRFDPRFAAELKSYGFDGFSLANNHAYDMGRKNVGFTREVLQENGLFYFGDEYNQGPQYSYIAGEEQNLPFKIGFIGLNATEGPMDMKKVQAAVDETKNQAEFVVINIHWGEEYKRNSNKFQQNLAHQLIDMGTDAIIGHHPHVIQEIEVYKDRPIFYSLGNFIFDQYWSQPTQEGISAALTFTENGQVTWHVLPFSSKRSQVEPMVGEKRVQFFKWLEKNSRNIEFSS